MNLEELGLLAQAIDSMLLLEKKLEKSMDRKDAESLKKEKSEILKLQSQIGNLLKNGN